jgi:hypothetical protein
LQADFSLSVTDSPVIYASVSEWCNALQYGGYCAYAVSQSYTAPTVTEA